jgi:ATP-dependent RNA helicase SUPV3L1/SUV3
MTSTPHKPPRSLYADDLDPVAPRPENLNLPQPRHAPRVPAHISKEQLARIRHAAHALPQVVKPADYGAEAGPAGDELLDRIGLVMLQKSSSGGSRPSRWIDPGLMDVALAQVKAIGDTPDARPKMLERRSALEALGVVQHAGEFSRLISHSLHLKRETWRVPVLYRLPLLAEPVWAFYRTGDRDALITALGPAQTYPHAGELTAHLDALVARSVQHAPQHMDSLLPRLQAECATPKALVSPETLADLKAACTRAQERWAHAATELEKLAGLNTELAFQGYPGTFAKARQMQRKVTLYLGPPNSGKTHAAFERLAQAQSGAYLAPLRLLALEGRDRLVARGVPCSLLTGEENVPAEGARVVSSTIEMVGTNKPVDVAVIDEAQMIFDASRGWAWTQAIVAVPAREVIIIGSSYAAPAIQNLLGLCGESCTVREFVHKQKVQLLPNPVPIQDLQLGDAVVAFSRRDVLMLRDQIAASGHPVSVIYGALPPEVRRREAERFAGGESHILVATDAIGMGLNLPIRRVFFSTMGKFDGVGDRPLDVSEVHQIAGRAGRYGMHDEGFVSVLAEAEPGAARLLKERLATQPSAPLDFKAPVAPNGWHVDTIAQRLNLTRLRDVLGVFMEQLKLDDAHFEVAELEQMLLLAEELDRCASPLSLNERFVYAQAPVDTRAEAQVQSYLNWAAGHAHTDAAGRPAFLDEVDGHSRLERMEQALRTCTLWLWLDLRFPGVYGYVDEVQALRSELNDGIERQLKGKRPLAQQRQRRSSGGSRSARDSQKGPR